MLTSIAFFGLFTFLTSLTASADMIVIYRFLTGIAAGYGERIAKLADMLKAEPAEFLKSSAKKSSAKKTRGQNSG